MALKKLEEESLRDDLEVLEQVDLMEEGKLVLELVGLETLKVPLATYCCARALTRSYLARVAASLSLLTLANSVARAAASSWVFSLGWCFRAPSNNPPSAWMQSRALFCKTRSRCLKITEKVSFNIASEASYVYILSGQKLLKIAQNSPFGDF